MQAGILEQSVRDNYQQMLLRPGCDLETYGDAHCLASKASYCSQGCVPESVQLEALIALKGLRC